MKPPWSINHRGLACHYTAHIYIYIYNIYIYIYIEERLTPLFN